MKWNKEVDGWNRNHRSEYAAQERLKSHFGAASMHAPLRVCVCLGPVSITDVWKIYQVLNNILQM